MNNVEMDINAKINLLVHDEVERMLSEDILKTETGKLSKMFEGKEDFRNILHQIHRVMTVLHRVSGLQDKLYAFGKEDELRVEIQKLSATYNSKPVVVITIISGSLTILGGAIGIFGAFPGTAVGNALAKVPGLKSIFDISAAQNANEAMALSKELAGRITSVGSGVSSGGQGSGIFAKFFEMRDESQRTVIQFYLQQDQRKHETAHGKAKEGSDLGRESHRQGGQAEDAHHSVFTQLSQISRS